MAPATLAALEAFGGPYESVKLPAVDPHGPPEQVEAYWRLLCELWATGEDFAIIEHDIEIHEAVVREFTECANPWCVNWYDGQQRTWTGRGDVPVPVVLKCALGCVRFRGELTRTHPRLLSHMTVRRWDRLDSQLASLLQRRGQNAHRHEPDVIHHHDYAAEVHRGSAAGAPISRRPPARRPA